MCYEDQGRSPSPVGVILSQGPCSSWGSDPGLSVPTPLPSPHRVPGGPPDSLALHTSRESHLGLGAEEGDCRSCSPPYRSAMKFPSRNFLLASGKGKTKHKRVKCFISMSVLVLEN